MGNLDEAPSGSLTNSRPALYPKLYEMEKEEDLHSFYAAVNCCFHIEALSLSLSHHLLLLPVREKEPFLSPHSFFFFHRSLSSLSLSSRCDKQTFSRAPDSVQPTPPCVLIPSTLKFVNFYYQRTCFKCVFLRVCWHRRLNRTMAVS